MTRRQLREWLPALRFVYGLGWDEIQDMPDGELTAHLDQLPTFLQLLKG